MTNQTREKLSHEAHGEGKHTKKARVMRRIRRTTAEQGAQVTEAEAGIRKAVVEPEQQRTEEEPDRAGRTRWRSGGQFLSLWALEVLYYSSHTQSYRV